MSPPNLRPVSTGPRRHVASDVRFDRLRSAFLADRATSREKRTCPSDSRYLLALPAWCSCPSALLEAVLAPGAKKTPKHPRVPRTPRLGARGGLSRRRGRGSWGSPGGGLWRSFSAKGRWDLRFDQKGPKGCFTPDETLRICASTLQGVIWLEAHTTERSTHPDRKVQVCFCVRLR